MAGDIFSKERAAVTLTSSGSSLTNGSAGSAGTQLDCTTGGNAPEDLQGQFELTCQWVTITSIAVNTIIAELYLVPKIDGTNLPDVDVTAGSSALPVPTFAGVFVATKAPTANTDARYVSGNVQFNPLKYTAYILNRSGQTITANWTLKVVSVRAQYT